MNSTIDFYNNNADNYYEQTASVDFSDLYERFLKYIPEGGRIMDVGCGSGRDAGAFCRMGFRAEGLDAAEELAALAGEKQGINVTVCNMEDWITDRPYDGIWCCAVLVHLEDGQIKKFFNNLRYNLAEGGVLFVSVKARDGNCDGYDSKGRYMRYFERAELRGFVEEVNGNSYGAVKAVSEESARLKILEEWESEDGMDRAVRWLNLIIRCRKELREVLMR